MIPPTSPTSPNGTVWVMGEHPHRISCFPTSWPETELQEKDGFGECCVLPLCGRSGAQTRVLPKNNGKDDIRHPGESKLWDPKKPLCLHCIPKDPATGEKGLDLGHHSGATTETGTQGSSLHSMLRVWLRVLAK